MHDSRNAAPAGGERVEAGYMVYRPTRRQRLLKWLGFNRSWIPEFSDDIEDRLPCGVVSETYIDLDFADRVRVLITGKIRVDQRHQCQIDPVAVLTRAHATVIWDRDD